MGEEARWVVGVEGSGGVQSPQGLQAERKVFLVPVFLPTELHAPLQHSGREMDPGLWLLAARSSLWGGVCDPLIS